MADDKPIIVIKKKGGHGGHHGGAWKVAYADFVTAMMAFFMVMWLLNTADVNTKQNIASYFKKPGIFEDGSGTPLMIGEAGILTDAYIPPHQDNQQQTTVREQQPMLRKSGLEDDDLKERMTPSGLKAKGIVQQAGKTFGYHSKETEDDYSGKRDPGRGTPRKADSDGDHSSGALQQMALQQMAQNLKEQLKDFPELQELLGMVDVKVEADGLNIEIMDTKKTSMFRSGSARVETGARAAFAKLASVLKKLPNTVEIVGHTDAVPFSSRTGGYSNWELSADRANAARRIMIDEGFTKKQIRGVVGKADRQPKERGNPFAPSNRRITLKMKFDKDLTVDLSNDPDALKAIQSQLPGNKPVQGQPAIDITAEDDFGEDESSITLTPDGKVAARRRKKGILAPPKEGAHPAGRERAPRPVFDKNPVFGPRDPFSDY